MKLDVKTHRVIDDLRSLSKFGQVGTGVNRRALTKVDIESRLWLQEQMRASGLETTIDEIGSVSGRTPNCEKYILIGSHTDTVPKGGWLDGAMGVIYGLELARAWVESAGESNIGIEVISFSDEEGRFGGLMGSGVYVGSRDPEAARELLAEDGKSLAEEVDSAGWSNVPALKLNPQKHCAYFEAHIEQGPILETRQSRIGVVTEIVGVRRARVEFTGRSEHAGTIPMAMRHDAAAAVFEFAQAFVDTCRRDGGVDTVWNLGHVDLEPGAYNVVCGRGTLFVEYRDGNPEVLVHLRKQIDILANDIAGVHRVTVKVEEQMRTEPAVMNKDLMCLIEKSAKDLGEDSIRMPSGAGHDAMLLAPLIPSAMLFVPSIDGRSHDVSEDTSEEDIALGVNVLAGAVGALIDAKR